MSQIQKSDLTLFKKNVAADLKKGTELLKTILTMINNLA